MSALTILQAGALCPAGTLADVYARFHHRPDMAALAGECGAAPLKDLAALVPGVSLRRVPRLAKIALRAALEARAAATPPGVLIISTAYGSVAETFAFMDSILADGAALASPTAFSHSVTNMTAAFVSQGLQIHGPSLTLTQPSLQVALEAAEFFLASGQADSVLWGIISERVGTMEDIEKISGRNPSPFNDGAVFFHLARPETDGSGLSLEFGRPVAAQEPFSLSLALGLALSVLAASGATT